jgi:hypothetical protein
MSIQKKRHLIAGTVIGGLLLAATLQTGNSFALSDTSSTNSGAQTNTTQQTPTNDTSTTPQSSNTPSTAPPSTGSVATGSTATQTSNNSTGVTSSTATATDPTSSTSPSTTPQSTDPSTATQTNNTTATQNVDSSAETGDASVKHTTTGGDTTTGNASAVTTLLNAIASSSNLSNGALQTFTYNVNGTQNGNVVIDPNNILTSTGTTGSTAPIACAPTNATVQNNSTINNLVNLTAQSGDAKVMDNGTGGNATSGNATTEADIINTIQDLVSSQGAFLGVININGNLNGNIELPESVVNALLTPTQTGDTAAGNATATNNFNINNNVTLTAISGTAAVTNNGTGGNATSGNASTVLNTCNLINSQIVGGNLLLVFVNVMGHWYGALLGEPTGSTSAEIGGGITQDTVSPTSQTTATNTSTINNTVDLTSITGSATVANNGVGGNATTGTATAIADITNILGSQINLSGWLGILIINVFGTWNGSLAIQPTSPTTTQTDSSNTTQQNQTTPSYQGATDDGHTYTIADPPLSLNEDRVDLASAQHVLGATTVLPDNNFGTGERPAAVTSSPASQSNKHLGGDYILAGIGFVLATAGGISRYFASRQKKVKG